MSIRPFLPAWKACSRAIEALRGKAATIPWHNSDPDPPVTMKQVFAESIKAERDRTEQYREIRSLRGTVRELTQIVMEKDGNSVEDFERQQYRERVHEWHEARQMTGTGPWLVAESRALLDEPGVTGMRLRESNPIAAQGAYGDIELALQNVNWRREINLSWLEFSRWGIQQIILISRLYYIKNPIIRRLIDIAAQYVFARGFELSSPDEDANQILKDFLERNQATIGQIALTNHERSKYQDGNLFFVFFPDEENTGEVNLRTIDATEIMDIICNPDDADDPWYYRRCWTQRSFDAVHGTVSTKSIDKWYPALGFDPEDRKNSDGSPMERIDDIAGVPIIWKNPVYHRKCGTVAKWHFGTPLIYPAIDWAREGRKYLEACASVMQSLMQIALIIKTKGGQQALAGVKAQQETSVGPNTALYDQNPPAVPGATFASGTGTSLEAFKTTGSGQDPEKVRQFKLMCCMVVGVPESFLGDLSCYADDTEVLTDQGFMLHQQWRPGIKIACFNPATEQIEYHHPNELRVFDHTGDMVHFSNRQVDVMVTPNHRMWCEPIIGWNPMEPSPLDLKRGAKVERGWRIVEAGEIEKRKHQKGWKFSNKVIEPATMGDTIETPLGIRKTEDWARFLGYWISEGCATQSVCKSGENRKDGTPIMRTFRRVQIAQKSGPVLDRMRQACAAIDVHYFEKVCTRAVVNIVIVQKLLWEHLRAECGHGAKSKRLPRWIFSSSMSARKAMYDALMEGDGGRSGSSWRYSSSSKQLADDVQLLAHSIGLAAAVTEEKRTWNGEPTTMFRVWIRTRATSCRVVKPKHISRKQYSGKVYCFSLPHGIYVTRRNGMIAVQGNTGNLATATSLDRPTELVFLERQEAWREDLVIIGKYVLSVSAKATNGKLREAMERRGIESPETLEFHEVARFLTASGKWLYVEEAQRKKMARPRTVEVKCTFPSIREGDIPQIITSITSAMTLGAKSGQVIGIDEKAGIKMLFETLGYENAAELVEEMYPEDTYDPERSQEEPLGAPIPGTTPPGTAPGAPGSPATPQQDGEDEPQQQGSPTPLPAQPANKALPANKIAVSAHVRSKPSKKLKEAVGRWLLMLEAGEPKP